MNIANELYRVARLLTGAMFEAPPVMVETITQWVISVQAAVEMIHNKSVMKGIEFEIEEGTASDFEVKEYERLEKENKKLDRIVSKSPFPVKVKYKTKRITKRVKVDLTGWKYLPRLKKNPEGLKEALKK